MSSHPDTRESSPRDQRANGPKPYAISLYRRKDKLLGWLVLGWRVTINRRSALIDRRFSWKEYGGMDQALKAAIAFRNQVNREYSPLTKRQMCATLRSNNTSGVPGVFRLLDKTGPYWKAHIHYADGRYKSRQFSINKYGAEDAYRRAVEARRMLLQDTDGHAALHPDMRDYRATAPEQEPVVVRQPFRVEAEDNPYARQSVCDVTGVGLSHVKTVTAGGIAYTITYWTATIKKANGLPKRRYFSIDRYGEEEAKRLAIEQRLAWEYPP